MIELLAVGVLLYLGYLFFVRGWFWVIGLLLFSVFGGTLLIWSFFPTSHGVAITAFGFHLSYAATISIIITSLGITVLDCGTK